ncbi:hypothetical protein QFZ62_001349 [Clavibacter sp. B3I6]|nr:hypothetical protein [Clavibacter sp. B3I6]
MPMRSTSHRAPARTARTAPTARRTGLVATAAAGAVLATLLAAPVGANAQEAPAGPVTAATGDASAVSAYWTAERRAEAVAAGDGSAPADASPAASSLEASDRAVPSRRTASGAGSVRPHAAVPYVGELFYVEDGRNRACTATVVSSPAGDVISTAASCVMDRARHRVRPLATFVPGSVGARAPYGVWPIRTAVPTEAWSTAADEADDVAFARVTSLSGARMQDATGSVVPAFDVPPAQAPASEMLRVFAYPQAAPYRGRQLVGCGAIAHRAAGAAGPAAIGCAVGDGAAGGPALSADGRLRSVVTRPADASGTAALATWGQDAADALATLVAGR